MGIRKIKAWVGKIMFSACTLISPKFTTCIRYKRAFKKKLNLKEPKTFNEKVLWLKLNRYMNNPLVIQCADKYRVREYISECGLERILVPLIAVYKKASDIEWEHLPQSFVLKWNFGATMNIICPDKDRMDAEKSIKQLSAWGKVRYWLPYAEMQYKYIDKKIVCEKYLSCTETDDIPDYKIYCFNGKPKYILVCFGRTNNTQDVHAKYVFFDMDWNIMPFSEYAINHSNHIDFDKPEGLDYAIECAGILAKPFPFVRADFYIVNGQVYFGELTFTPAGGMDTDLFSGDSIMGDMIKLD